VAVNPTVWLSDRLSMIRPRLTLVCGPAHRRIDARARGPRLFRSRRTGIGLGRGGFLIRLVHDGVTSEVVMRVVRRAF